MTRPLVSELVPALASGLPIVSYDPSEGTVSVLLPPDLKLVVLAADSGLMLVAMHSGGGHLLDVRAVRNEAAPEIAGTPV